MKPTSHDLPQNRLFFSPTHLNRAAAISTSFPRAKRKTHFPEKIARHRTKMLSRCSCHPDQPYFLTVVSGTQPVPTTGRSRAASSSTATPTAGFAPRDDMRVEHYLDNCTPIQKQLLGVSYSGGRGYTSPTPEDAPLKAWLEEHGISNE